MVQTNMAGQVGCSCSKEVEFGKMQGDIKAIFKRIDEQTQMTKAVYELTSEVRVFGNSLEHMVEVQKATARSLEKMETRMDSIDQEMKRTSEEIKQHSDNRDADMSRRIQVLEDKDGKTWSSIKEKVLTAIVAGVVGVMVTLFFSLLAAYL